MIDLEQPSVIALRELEAFVVQHDEESTVTVTDDQCPQVLSPIETSTVQQVVDEAPVLVDEPAAIVVLSAGEQGPPGRDGAGASKAYIDVFAHDAAVRGQVLRVGNGNGFATDYTDPLAATWQLGLADQNGAIGDSIRVQLAGDFSDVAYGLQPGRIWLGGPGQRYAQQAPPPNTPGVVQAVLGNSTGGSVLYFNPDAPSVFTGVSP